MSSQDLRCWRGRGRRQRRMEKNEGETYKVGVVLRRNGPADPDGREEDGAVKEFSEHEGVLQPASLVVVAGVCYGE